MQEFIQLHVALQRRDAVGRACLAFAQPQPADHQRQHGVGHPADAGLDQGRHFGRRHVGRQREVLAQHPARARSALGKVTHQFGEPRQPIRIAEHGETRTIQLQGALRHRQVVPAHARRLAGVLGVGRRRQRQQDQDSVHRTVGPPVAQQQSADVTQPARLQIHGFLVADQRGSSPLLFLHGRGWRSQQQHRSGGAGRKNVRGDRDCFRGVFGRGSASSMGPRRPLIGSCSGPAWSENASVRGAGPEEDNGSSSARCAASQSQQGSALAGDEDGLPVGIDVQGGVGPGAWRT